MLTVTGRFARRFRYLRLLQVSLVAGAAYNLAAAALLAAAPAAVAQALDLAPLAPGVRLLLVFAALLIFMLAALYLFAARDPRRYSAIILVAIAGRLGGASLLALGPFLVQASSTFYLPAALELAFGTAHAILWRPVHA